MSVWNDLEYYTYLNGMKVGVYIEDEGGLMSPGTAGLYSYYFSYDGQGNVVQVSNKAGELPYHIYTYDSYGSTTEGGGSYEGHLLASYKGYDRGPFGYKTGVRQYDPETGRFLSPDPFKGYMTDPASQHPYMYCRGNPVRYSDPSGYDAKFWVVIYEYGESSIPRSHSALIFLIKVNGKTTYKSVGFTLKGVTSPDPLLRKKFKEKILYQIIIKGKGITNEKLYKIALGIKAPPYKRPESKNDPKASTCATFVYKALCKFDKKFKKTGKIGRPTKPDLLELYLDKVHKISELDPPD